MAKRSQYRKAPQADVACNPCIKVHAADIAGLEREAEDRLSYDAKNIDPDRSKLNLRIHGLDMNGKPVINHDRFESSLEQRIMDRIKSAGAVIRRDKEEKISMEKKGFFVPKGKNTKESVVAEGIIFQLSHKLAMELLEKDGLLEEDRIRKDAELEPGMLTYQYFADVYSFICKKYGEKNVVGAYVHLDEYTPHMHAFVVPITQRKRVYAGKEILDKEGNPVMKAYLDAKHIFCPETIRQLWAEHGLLVQRLGATVAQGLVPKGEYDKVASIEGMAKKANALYDEVELIQQQISDLTAKIAQRQSQLSALYTAQGLGVVETMNEVIMKDIQELGLMRIWKGDMISFTPQNIEFYDAHSEEGVRIDMLYESKRYYLEVSLEDGRVWMNGEKEAVRSQKAGEELHMRELARYFRGLKPETKELLQSLYSSKEDARRRIDLAPRVHEILKELLPFSEARNIYWAEHIENTSQRITCSGHHNYYKVNQGQKFMQPKSAPFTLTVTAEGSITLDEGGKSKKVEEGSPILAAAVSCGLIHDLLSIPSGRSRWAINPAILRDLDAKGHPTARVDDDFDPEDIDPDRLPLNPRRYVSRSL